MRKTILTILTILAVVPSVAFATPVQWDFSGGNLLQPLPPAWNAQIKGSYFTATSTLSTATSTLRNTNLVGPTVEILGEYITNFTNYIRSKFTNGTGLNYSAGTFSLANTAVTPASYTNASITVDQQGRITSAANGTASGTGTVTSITAGDGLLGGTITTSGTFYGQLGTSTTPVISNIPYFTSLGTASAPAKFANVATSSITASGVLSFSNPIAGIGPSASALTVTGGSNGQVLGWLSGVPTWTASSSIAAGTGISISPSGAVTTVTNTGVLSLGPTGQTLTGAVGQATSTSAFNGLTSALTIVGSSPTLTYTPSLSGLLTIGGGGTGISSYTAGDILYASAPTTFARVASTTDGFILSLANGKPTWVATTTLSNIGGSLSIAKGGTGLTSLTGNRILYSDSTGANLLQIATSSLNLGISGGGTGLTSLTGNRILYSDSTGANLLQVATSTLNLGVAGGGTGAVTLTGCLTGNGTGAITGSGTCNTSNATVSSITAGDGLLGGVLTTSGTIFGQLGTSSTPVISNIPYFTSLGTASAPAKFANVATSTNGTANTVATFDSAGRISPVYASSTASSFSQSLVGTRSTYTGALSPLRSLVLGTATTTTWTASTTASAYLPMLVMPVAGTIQQARCVTDASFVGVNIQIAGSNITPSYFVASTTVGIEKFTGTNTFTAGQKLSADFGTTTTATTKSVACTIDFTETP